MEKQFESLKWHLWHGNVYRVLQLTGDRCRLGEAISMAFVESTVNQVISKRMVKKQEVSDPAGTHLLPPVHTQVLNDDLWDTARE